MALMGQFLGAAIADEKGSFLNMTVDSDNFHWEWLTTVGSCLRWCFLDIWGNNGSISFIWVSIQGSSAWGNRFWSRNRDYYTALSDIQYYEGWSTVECGWDHSALRECWVASESDGRRWDRMRNWMFFAESNVFNSSFWRKCLDERRPKLAIVVLN